MIRSTVPRPVLWYDRGPHVPISSDEGMGTYNFGHRFYGTLRGLDATFSTVLRNPVDRVISYYNHAHAHFKMERRYSLLAFMDTGPHRVQCHNFQLRYLTRLPVGREGLTEAHLEDAKEVIATEVHAGVQELMAKTFRYLPITQGRAIPARRINSSEDGFTRHSFSDLEIAEIKRRNALDFAIYDAALSHLRAFEPEGAD